MILALILSLSLNLGLVALTLFSLRVIDRKNREQVRERQSHAFTTKELLDRLMHTTGNTWTPPPREVSDEEVIDEELKAALEGWVNV